jgi:hypothetical protein
MERAEQITTATFFTNKKPGGCPPGFLNQL